jgi:hypothetical protein
MPVSRTTMVETKIVRNLILMGTGTMYRAHRTHYHLFVKQIHILLLAEGATMAGAVAT